MINAQFMTTGELLPPIKVERRWKDSCKALKNAVESSEPAAAKGVAALRMKMLRESLFLYFNVPDSHRGSFYKREVLRCGIREAEHCFKDDNECLRLQVLMDHLYSDGADAYAPGVPESLWRLKERSQTLYEAFPKDPPTLELIGSIILSASSHLWYEHLFAKLPPSPSPADALSFFKPAFEATPTQRLSLLLGEAYYADGQYKQAKEYYGKCRDWPIQEADTILAQVYEAECSLFFSML